MTALSEKAVLVRVIGCTWSGRRTDKVVAEGAAKHFDTTSNWVSGSKRLVDPAVIAEPKKILGAARNYLRGDSVGPLDGEFITGGLPSWDDKGWYILPNALNEKVLRNLGEFRSQFEAALEDLRDALPAAIKRARDENPKLWSADDYAGGVTTRPTLPSLWQSGTTLTVSLMSFQTAATSACRHPRSLWMRSRRRSRAVQTSASKRWLRTPATLSCPRCAISLTVCQSMTQKTNGRRSSAIAP